MRAGSVSFTRKVGVVGVNPFVAVPAHALRGLREEAGRPRGPIPVRGRLNGAPFRQTVVKFRGVWRLYLNGAMRTAAGVNVGDDVAVRLSYDPAARVVPVPSALRRALAEDGRARRAFGALAPSRRTEILRYLASLKTAASVERNVAKVKRRLAARGAARRRARRR